MMTAFDVTRQGNDLAVFNIMKAAFRASVAIFAGILAASGFLGCASMSQYGKLENSARKNYQVGRYDEAVFECVKSLRINPDYEKSQRLIQDAFAASVDAHKARIKELGASSAKFKWDGIVSEGEALINVNEAVRRLPILRDKKTGVIIKLEVVDYSDKLAEAKTNAAEAHYQEGVRLSANTRDLDIQKQAAKEFRTAATFVPGYKNATSLYEKTRRAGIKRIAIIPFEDRSGEGYRYGAVADNLTDRVIANIMNDPGAMEFLEIVSRDQLQQVMNEQKLGTTGILDERSAVRIGDVLGVHEIMTGRITGIIYAGERTISRQEQATANVVVGEKTTYNSEGKAKKVKVWGDVSANLRIYTRTSSAKMDGSYQIIDVKTARVMKSDFFSGQSEFNAEWATYYGDERAVRNNVLVKRTEQPAPVAREMVNQAVGNLAGQLAGTLKQYVR